MPEGPLTYHIVRAIVQHSKIGCRLSELGQKGGLALTRSSDTRSAAPPIAAVKVSPNDRWLVHICVHHPTRVIDGRPALTTVGHLSRFHSAKLMDPLSRKSISTVPKHANRTPFAFVIDPLLVRATDYAIGHCNRQHVMLIDKFQYLAGDTGVGTNITTI